MSRIESGASTERGGDEEYPDDGILQGVDTLDFLAASQGFYFYWHKDSKSYTLEPMSAEDLAAFKAARAAEREEIIRQVEHEARVAEVTASDFDTEEDFQAWEENNR